MRNRHVAGKWLFRW